MIRRPPRSTPLYSSAASDVYKRQLKDDKSIGLRGIIIDISERKQAEHRIQHLARLYALLSQINEAIVRIQNKEELFKTICDVAVKYGQFRMAWIAFVDEADNLVKPVVFEGHEDGYLEEIQATKGFKSTENWPVGFAFQTGTIT